MSKYVISHGQLREIPDDELMHWKYIKRKKVNGKWRYYYDIKDAMGYDERDRMNKAEIAKKDADEQAALTEKWYKRDFEDYSTLAKYDAPVKSVMKKYDAFETAYEMHKENVKKQTKAGREYMSAKSEFMKTPLGKITKFKNNIASRLEKMAKKLRG